MEQSTLNLNDSRRARTLFILYLTGFTTMLGIGIITPVLPIYAQMIGATGFWIGAIFSVFALSRTIFMPFVGRLSDAGGRRKFILLGLAGYAFFSALYVPADNVLILTIVRFFSRNGSSDGLSHRQCLCRGYGAGR